MSHSTSRVGHHRVAAVLASRDEWKLLVRRLRLGLGVATLGSGAMIGAVAAGPPAQWPLWAGSAAALLGAVWLRAAVWSRSSRLGRVAGGAGVAATALTIVSLVPATPPPWVRTADIVALLFLAAWSLLTVRTAFVARQIDLLKTAHADVEAQIDVLLGPRQPPDGEVHQQAPPL